MTYSEKVELIPGISLRESVAETLLDAIAKRNCDATARAIHALQVHFPHLTLGDAKRAVDKIREAWC